MVVVKVDTSPAKIGSIILAKNDRENMGREEGIIVEVGEHAFNDLSVNIPKVGDRVVIARYDGKKLDNEIDNIASKDTSFELRVIQDTKILTLVEEIADTTIEVTHE